MGRRWVRRTWRRGQQWRSDGGSAPAREHAAATGGRGLHAEQGCTGCALVSPNPAPHRLLLALLGRLPLLGSLALGVQLHGVVAQLLQEGCRWGRQRRRPRRRPARLQAAGGWRRRRPLPSHSLCCAAPAAATRTSPRCLRGAAVMWVGARARRGREAATLARAGRTAAAFAAIVCMLAGSIGAWGAPSGLLVAEGREAAREYWRVAEPGCGEQQ